MKTIAYRIQEPWVVLAHSTEPTTDAEWQAYVDACFAQRVSTILVWTPGPGPSASQRRYMTERWQSKFAGLDRTVVVTPSILARGIVTALSWAGFRIWAFAPDQLEGAIRHLGLEPQRAAVSGALADCRAELEA